MLAVVDGRARNLYHSLSKHFPEISLQHWNVMGVYLKTQKLENLFSNQNLKDSKSQASPLLSNINLSYILEIRLARYAFYCSPQRGRFSRRNNQSKSTSFRTADAPPIPQSDIPPRWPRQMVITLTRLLLQNPIHVHCNEPPKNLGAATVLYSSLYRTLISFNLVITIWDRSLNALRVIFLLLGLSQCGSKLSLVEGHLITFLVI